MWLFVKEGMTPVKVLLLTLRSIRFGVRLEKRSLNRATETITGEIKWLDCRRQYVPQLSRKPIVATSMVRRLFIEEKSPSGRGPDRKLHDRFRRERVLRDWREEKITPRRPLSGTRFPVSSQSIPSPEQQSTTASVSRIGNTSTINNRRKPKWKKKEE